MRLDTRLSSDEESVLRKLLDARESKGSIEDYIYALEEAPFGDHAADYKLSVVRDLADLGYIRYVQCGNTVVFDELTSLGVCYFADKAKRESDERSELRKERSFRIFIVVLAAAMSILSGVVSSCITTQTMEQSYSPTTSQEAESLTLDPSGGASLP